MRTHLGFQMKSAPCCCRGEVSTVCWLVATAHFLNRAAVSSPLHVASTGFQVAMVRCLFQVHISWISYSPERENQGALKGLTGLAD